MAGAEAFKPPRWLKPANKVFVLMSRLGLSFGGESPVVLTVPGRKTGAPRSTPVTPMTLDGKRYVVGGFPGADWVRNARAAGEATLERGRHSERVRIDFSAATSAAARRCAFDPSNSSLTPKAIATSMRCSPIISGALKSAARPAS